MTVLDNATAKTQAFWGLDKDTAEMMCLFVAMRQLIHDDVARHWEEMHAEFPFLFELRKIRCMECETVIVFFPADGTIAVRDDGELICLECTPAQV